MKHQGGHGLSSQYGRRAGVAAWALGATFAGETPSFSSLFSRVWRS